MFCSKWGVRSTARSRCVTYRVGEGRFLDGASSFTSRDTLQTSVDVFICRDMGYFIPSTSELESNMYFLEQMIVWLSESLGSISLLPLLVCGGWRGGILGPWTPHRRHPISHTVRASLRLGYPHLLLVPSFGAKSPSCQCIRPYDWTKLRILLLSCLSL
jgi:hypothetical protein